MGFWAGASPRPLARRVRPVDMEVHRPAQTAQHDAPAPVAVGRGRLRAKHHGRRDNRSLRHGSSAAGLAARGESPAAFDRCCIPPACVAPRSHTAGIFPRRALPDGRITGLGATRDFHHGLLVDTTPTVCRSVRCGPRSVRVLRTRRVRQLRVIRRSRARRSERLFCIPPTLARGLPIISSFGNAQVGWFRRLQE